MEADEDAESVSLLVARSYEGAKVLFSGAFGGADAPGAFGTENLANDTGLNVAGRFAEPLRACRPSVRLASDSEPPCDAVSSPASDPDASPFSSRARVATSPVPLFGESCATV